jgi:hypothetical protein
MAVKRLIDVANAGISTLAPGKLRNLLVQIGARPREARAAGNAESTCTHGAHRQQAATPTTAKSSASRYGRTGEV